MTAYERAYQSFRQALAGPLEAWYDRPPAKKTWDAYERLFSIPLDLAACGWTVTMAQRESGWRIAATLRVGPRKIAINGSAPTYAAALGELMWTAPAAFARAEAAERADPGEEAA